MVVSNYLPNSQESYKVSFCHYGRCRNMRYHLQLQEPRKYLEGTGYQKNSDTPWRGKGGTEGMLEEIQMPVVAIMDTLELIARTGRSMKISSRQIKTNQRLLSSINAEADDYRYDGTMHLDA